jgi:hypothetical protein
MHAAFAPSAASRWLNCPGSVRAEAQCVDSPSNAANLGTLLHEVAAEALIKNMDVTHHTELTPEQLSLAKIYASYIRSFEPSELIEIEQRVVFDEHVYGTADAILIVRNVLHIVDFKTGQQKVFAFQNEQLMTYAAAAFRQYGPLFDIEKITLHIVQPSLDHFDYWELLPEELLNHAERITFAVERALSPEAPLLPSEKACAWCKARFTCKAWASHALEIAKQEFALVEPKALTPEQLAQVLIYKARIEKWLSDAQDFALEAVLKGGVIPHFTLGETRSVRYFFDETEVIERLLEEGYDKDDFIKTKFLPLTSIEKLVGKKKFAELFGDLIAKKPGKPALIPCTETAPSLYSAVMLAAEN